MANKRALLAQEKLVRGFGHRLQARRRDAGWTQRQLAAESGVPYGVIGRVEAGLQVGVAPLTLYRLAFALGMRMEELMGVPPLGVTEGNRGR